jgi:anti-sigma B factor antagonist
MRVLMDDIDIASGSDGTRVELRRRLSAGPAVAAPARSAPPAEAGATLALALARERGVTVARLRGEVDLAGIADLGRALAAAARDGDRGLVLDLGDIAYLDSAGLHLLHDAARALAARGQTLRLAVAPGAAVLRLLELVDIEQTVPLHPSVAAAVDALTPPSPL